MREECSEVRESQRTDRARERGVSPLVNGALSLLMLSFFWGEEVSSVACGVMGKCVDKCVVDAVKVAWKL
jgi:hypothetical protein